MRSMLRKLTPLLALALIGCSADGHPTPSPACSDTPASIEQALRSAPARVSLADGTTLSACVERARDDAQLQDIGSALSTAADELASRAGTRGNAAAAVQLGYLVGAARRGAARTNGVAAELVRRLEQAASSAPPTPLAVGLQAGERSG